MFSLLTTLKCSILKLMVRIIYVIFFWAMSGILAFLAPSTIGHADQSDPRLAGLFSELRHSSNSERAKETSSKIWEIWSEHPEDKELTEALLSGIQLLNSGRLSDAEQVFSAIIVADDTFAEAWNKRATVYFLMGEYVLSKKDIAQTIMREPRHFGALSGLGLVETHLGNYEAALKAYHKAAALHPYLDGYENIVSALTKLNRGNPT